LTNRTFSPHLIEYSVSLGSPVSKTFWIVSSQRRHVSSENPNSQ
jgi:hypothetical protein